MPGAARPCPCPGCDGAVVSYATRKRHEVRELRELSLRAPTSLSIPHDPRATVAASSLSPPVLPPSAPAPGTRALDIPVPLAPQRPIDVCDPELTALTAATEAAGREHARAIAESGELFLPSFDDDWETSDPSPDDPVLEDVPDDPALNEADENDPDPFYYPPEGAQPLPTSSQIHPNPAVYPIYVVVLWCHSQFHLPFRACSALLTVIALAFKAGGAPIQPAMHTTLPSVIHQLGAEPSLAILPVCPKCLKCSHPLFTTTRSRSENPRPHLQFPTKSLAEQLAIILSDPEIEEEIENSLKRPLATKPGKWTNIFDGKICQELPTADGSRFFFPTEEEVAAGELRIGVTMGLDWFSYLRSQLSASHTSCPISYSLINLLAHHRYRTAYLILAGIMPGPKEANPDECQRFLRPLISELLRLWKDGVVIVTPKYPQGRLVRVALVAVVCDKPAAHKVGGFGSHAHTNFCTMYKN